MDLDRAAKLEEGLKRWRKPLPCVPGETPNSVSARALTSRPFLAREESPGSWPGAGTIRLEQDVFSALAGQGQIYVHLTEGIWSQIKSAGYVGAGEEPVPRIWRL